MEHQNMEFAKQSEKPVNPLQKYFRQPAIYIKLPSGGQYWGAGSLNLPVTGEIPVYPLTTRDEITLRTPDALMNGAGVVEAIQSCCPSILNAWEMPSIDVDTVLIAVRIASYGHDMDFDVNCPHCQSENTFSQDLREILAAVKVPDFSQTLETENLIIKLKPAAYFSTNLNNQINFEEQKLLRAVEQTELPDEERSNIIQTSMKRLIDIGLDNLTAVTEYIATADGDVVTDAAFIREFYYNVSSDTVNKINSQLAEFTKENSLPPLNATCTSCTKPFEVPVEFNYSSFFGKGF
jgi:hypothetical protein